jgi:ABC-type multidrug transport system, permease component
MRFTAVVEKELRQLVRDPKTVVMVLLMPVILTILFGYGYGGKTSFPIAIVNMDQKSGGYALSDQLRNMFDIRAYARTREEAIELVREGRIYAAVVIPKGFTDDMMAGRTASLEIIYDASEPVVAQSIMQMVGVIVLQFELWASEKFGTFSISPLFYSVYGPSTRRVENFMPILMGTLLQLVPTSLISVSVCRERERGTFEQFAMTPASRFDIILGKLAAYFIATISDVFLTISIAMLLFGVQFRGGMLDIMLLSSFFLICSLSMGLLISVLSRNQLQAYQASIFAFIPSMLFSGMFTPVNLLSDVAKAVGYSLPLYYYLDAFKAIAFKGMSLQLLTYDLEVILIFTVVFSVLSINLLRMRVE